MMAFFLSTWGSIAMQMTHYKVLFILSFWQLASGQWKRLPTGNEPPPARAYHSMTCIGSRYLLFGGFDGKSTFGELWWLVPEGTNFTVN